MLLCFSIISLSVYCVFVTCIPVPPLPRTPVYSCTLALLVLSQIACPRKSKLALIAGALSAYTFAIVPAVEAMFENVLPLLVICQDARVSFHLIATLALDPRSTIILAPNGFGLVTPLFNVIVLLVIALSVLTIL